ncbi:hypothetical protein BB560_005257 [Smittium megazygosporum]|uniref:TLDc domain-containing protein n=1 Tax=Smittium megazygosporum TaxID=133381 RepID=A0A2T9Z6Z2_9FUNG|nr:hypothetical protein BB560_005257 [Smittium megazygosporum]
MGQSASTSASNTPAPDRRLFRGLASPKEIATQGNSGFTSLASDRKNLRELVNLLDGYSQAELNAFDYFWDFLHDRKPKKITFSVFKYLSLEILKDVRNEQDQIWYARNKLITAAFIEAESNFTDDDDVVKRRSSIENHVKDALEDSIFDFSSVDESSTHTIDPSTLVEDSNSVDQFLQMLKNAEDELLEFSLSYTSLKTTCSDLILLIQSLYILEKQPHSSLVESSDYSDSNESQDTPKDLSTDNMEKDLEYISSFVLKSILRLFSASLKEEDIMGTQLSFSDTMKWVSYCGYGIYVSLSKYLFYKIVTVPSLVPSDGVSEFKKIPFSSYNDYVGSSKTLDSSEILSEPSLFLLSMKSYFPERKNYCSFQGHIRTSRLNEFSYMFDSQTLQNLSRSSTFPASGIHSLSQSNTMGSELEFENTYFEHKGYLEEPWDKLFSTTTNGFGMGCLLEKTLHYAGPTLLLVEGKVSEKPSAQDRRNSSNSFMDYSSSLSSPKFNERVKSNPLFKPGEVIKIGAYISTEWVKSERRVFGDEDSFLFIFEPFFLFLPSTASINKSTDPQYKNASSKNIALPSFGHSNCDEICYSSCSFSTGLQFGGLNQTSKTSHVLSSSLAPSSIFASTTVLSLDLASENAMFCNDPFLAPPNPVYLLLSPTNYFKLNINLDKIELYGLGGKSALENQKSNILFDIQDARKRQSVNILSRSIHQNHPLSSNKEDRFLYKTRSLIP